MEYFFDDDGNLIRETTRNEAGDLDRLGDQPAVIDYCPKTGVAKRWEWWRDQKPHRDGDKPAIYEIYPETGQERGRAYYKNGKAHTEENEVTAVRYTERGTYISRSFSIAGRRHRTDGPALETYNRDTGELERAQYFLMGKEVEPF
ncbi:hypothetical protein [uncultured Tateyamaria sp.]|uniref:hypothetical protein n=1 Tax=uncultured Tateyamaria sp. TaxID=455651 RepID=UPI002603A739|nr:hypothetical protein [uncultured Tateyamaria sp.]